MDLLKVEPLERWRLYREYLQHEDELIHQRLNWMLLLQGFLFASFASVYSGMLESSWDKPTELHAQIQNHFGGLIETLHTFTWVIPILGYLISLFSLFGVHAARKAIELLEKRWNREQYQLPDSIRTVRCRGHFPKMTGGGATHVEEMDSPLPFGIPIILCLGWTFLGMAQFLAPGELFHWQAWRWWNLAFLPLMPPTLMLCKFGLLRMARKAWGIVKWVRNLCRPRPGGQKVTSVRNMPANLTRQFRRQTRNLVRYLDEAD